MSHTVVILAAGQGTRMKSARAKVLHEVAGRPMLGWVLDAAIATRPSAVMVVVGHEAEAVRASLPAGVSSCVQEPQNGTGHAVAVAMAAIGELDPDHTVLVIPGDTPLIGGETLARLVEGHHSSGAAATVLTAVLDEPAGYGRVVRNDDGAVVAIVEQRDADAATLEIKEVNSGMYAFRAGDLEARLAELRPDNDQGEYYLTDVAAGSVELGRMVRAIVADATQIAGVNSHAQLAGASAVARRAILETLMAEGVSVVDPARTYVDHGVAVGAGAILHPGVHLHGASSVGAGAMVGPDVYCEDSTIGPGARVWYSVLRSASVGAECEVGPYASLRPGTVLKKASKAGTFVEMKKTVLGERAKVPHLSYLGDATVGERANVGAGTITCNYDGFEKHETHIGDDAFIGSDTMLVAPVTIGKGAFTGAGSVISKDVPEDGLGVERSDQRVIPGYAARRRARYRKRDG